MLLSFNSRVGFFLIFVNNSIEKYRSRPSALFCTDLFTEKEKEIINTANEKYEENIVSEGRKMKKNKIWYELASGKSLKELSDAYYTGEDYFKNYDELSNWIHPQRLTENLSYSDFTQNLPFEYYIVLVNNLFWEIDNMADDIVYIVTNYEFTKSEALPIIKYDENINKILEVLKKLV